MKKIAHCYPVGNAELFDSSCDSITAFPGISVSNCTMALKTWNKTRESENAVRREYTMYKAIKSQPPRQPVKDEHTNLDTMAFYTINLD